MKNRVVVSRISMMAMRVPIGGTQMNLDVADDQVAIRLSIFLETHRCPRKIGAAAVIPESGLDDFDGSTIVRGEDRLVKLLEPKRLHFEFRGRAHRFFAQGKWRQIGRFHFALFFLGKIDAKRQSREKSGKTACK